MVLDTSTIDTIDKAKSAQYGGAILGDADKAIFDNAGLKKSDGSVDVEKLQSTAKLLDNVK